MSGRDYSVLEFDLASNVKPRRDSLAYKYAFVSKLPAVAAELVKVRIDGGDPITIARGDRLTACAGGAIGVIEVVAPQLSGTLEITLSNEGLVPLASGGAAGGADAPRRLVEAWWLPHLPAQAGDPFQAAALPAGAPFWSVVNSAGAGLPPVMASRGMRCAQAITGAGGASGFLGSPAWPWQRKRVEVGVTGASMLSRVGARILSFNVEFLLRCDGQGNSHGGAGLGTGLQLLQGRGTAANLSGGVAGLGIVRDNVAGAGAWWRFVACAIDGGGLTIDLPLPQPAGFDVRKWTRARLELVDADPIAARDGTVNVYLDDAFALGFDDMASFPPASDGALRTGMDFQCIGESLQADCLFWTRGHWWIDSVIGGAP